jgi:hypothetical protein
MVPAGEVAGGVAPASVAGGVSPGVAGGWAPAAAPTGGAPDAVPVEGAIGLTKRPVWGEGVWNTLLAANLLAFDEIE